MRTLILLLTLLTGLPFTPAIGAQDMQQWFRQFRQQASPAQLYAFLHAMPKGGDIHHHLTGAGFSQWWWDIATDPDNNGGYHYFTRVRPSLCHGYGTNAFGSAPDWLMFHTLSAFSYQQLSDCEKQQYRALETLSPEEKSAFFNSIRLDKPHEGRDEFFQTHWQRLGDMLKNPHIQAFLLLKNMQAYAGEQVHYLETQVNVMEMRYPDGSPYTPEDALAVFEQMLASEAALNTGVEVRFQYALLRFLPHAEQQLEKIWAFVDRHRERYVGINFVGREDNDKGYPLRFLSTLRALRARYPQIALSIHAGESDEPNQHIKDTLLLGADRIGHGFNLIHDPDTLLLMRHNRYLVEINLISNLLLEYSSHLDDHPFPEYLRTGVAVTLSTDDRGMWSSNLTDEYYLAVTHFNLSWNELVQLNRNALQYSFLPYSVKSNLIERLGQKTASFVQQRLTGHAVPAVSTFHQFICGYAPEVCKSTQGAHL